VNAGKGYEYNSDGGFAFKSAPMTIQQRPELADLSSHESAGSGYRDTLTRLIAGNLDFHDDNSLYSSHNFHPFPAKFPPQLPRLFIEQLTKPNDVVLDPMMGSGTTVLEACLAERHAIGLDIDPLAITISNVKTTPYDKNELIKLTKVIVAKARESVGHRRMELESALQSGFDPPTRRFLDTWFPKDTQLELLALIREIEWETDYSTRSFFELAFSGVIITKSGGVSCALDLAHTRPHRAKLVLDASGRVLLGHRALGVVSSERDKLLTKTIRSAIEEFERRVLNNLRGVLDKSGGFPRPYVTFGDARSLSLDENSVDLIVTSPPYASNAIDYMRAHKFALVWMGYSIVELSERRREYIGSEVTQGVDLVVLPPRTIAVIEDISVVDARKGLVLRRYYSEMALVLREMLRVLRPGKAAIVVVGSSLMRGRDTQTGDCLAEIGMHLGFGVAGVGTRNLDRNRRMLPAGHLVDANSQIQQRMHKEHVIAFWKPTQRS
jgi:DNA modification methylase